MPNSIEPTAFLNGPEHSLVQFGRKVLRVTLATVRFEKSGNVLLKCRQTPGFDGVPDLKLLSGMDGERHVVSDSRR
jgi:hypothetical protein